MTREIILGPPGTGKTTKLLGMVEQELARGVHPDRIGFVSFTKKAAHEAIERACHKFNLTKDDLPYFRTLHSLCFHALGLSNSDVFEGKKLIEFGDWLGVEFSNNRFSDDGLMTGFTPGDRAIFMENLSRVQCLSLRQQYEVNHDGLPWSFVSRIQRGLEQFKKDKYLVDYTDMLVQFANSDWTPNLDVLFVDEAQDLSILQWHVVEKLETTCRRVVIAGDDDQAIYRWAGAAVEHFVELPGNPTVLGQSWRCPPEVQGLSDEMIQRVRHRRPKEWKPRDTDEGIVERLKSFEHGEVPGDDVLVLGRNAFALRSIMDDLKSRGVIYEWKGHPSVSRRILSAVRIWENLRKGERVSVDEARQVYEFIKSGNGGVKRGYKKIPNLPPDALLTMQELRERHGLEADGIWHEALGRIPGEEMAYMLRARKNGEKLITSRPRIRLSTIHGAKGGEADHVVLLSDMARRTYQEMKANPEDEARVFYVAVTRAKRRLSVIAPSSKMFYDV